MAQPQVYEGTLDEITLRYGKELKGRHLKVVVDGSSASPPEGGTPFYETATTEEWIRALRAGVAGDNNVAPPLAEAAVDRESIYEGRGE